MKFKEIRKKYPKFVYEKYFWKISGNNLEIFFDFKIEPGIRFKPKIIIENIPKRWLAPGVNHNFNHLIFHLGLIEMISYWKATCSPIIEIKAGSLSREQIRWWQDLIKNGMGQFFYENKIGFQNPCFIVSNPVGFGKFIVSNPVGFGKFICSEQKTKPLIITKLKNRYLVPFSGGRDSIATLEKLKEQKKEITLFSVNPIKQIQKTAEVSGIKKQIVVKRGIDKKLLELNKKGYLNGHTPFTALLSFLSVLCAFLFDCKRIVFSNEKSANEGNTKYLGKTINHQYSKSSEFEKKFKSYCKKYLVKNINYHNFLRKYTDFEISKMFGKYPKYFSVFSSCNAAMKIKPSLKSRWCGKCPKCLFVYMTLYPYLKKQELIKIFNEDLFEKKELLSIMKSLIGQGKHKPFECVGTYKESRTALNLCLKKASKAGEIPFLLKYFKTQSPNYP